ncbi:hypothetical protein FB451DRAFT_1393480 [Mycena latifolia]|nr:hypothetical protein FB451DRAFT_1393480 [Mycena latifolia]
MQRNPPSNPSEIKFRRDPVIQLVAPPRHALPPLSASPSSSTSFYGEDSAYSSSAYSSSLCSADDDAADNDAAEDDDEAAEGSYCSSLDDGEEEDERFAPAPPSPTSSPPPPVPIVVAPPSSRKRSSPSSEAEGSRASKRSRTSPSIASHSQSQMQNENDDTPRPRAALLLTPPSSTALALARRHTSPRSARQRLSPLSHPTSSSSTGAGTGHHRAHSWSARSTAETEGKRTVCGAAVAYALEVAAKAVGVVPRGCVRTPAVSLALRLVLLDAHAHHLRSVWVFRRAHSHVRRGHTPPTTGLRRPCSPRAHLPRVLNTEALDAQEARAVFPPTLPRSLRYAPSHRQAKCRMAHARFLESAPTPIRCTLRRAAARTAWGRVSAVALYSVATWRLAEHHVSHGGVAIAIATGVDRVIASVVGLSHARRITVWMRSSHPTAHGGTSFLRDTSCNVHPRDARIARHLRLMLASPAHRIFISFYLSHNLSNISHISLSHKQFLAQFLASRSRTMSFICVSYLRTPYLSSSTTLPVRT